MMIAIGGIATNLGHWVNLQYQHKTQLGVANLQVLWEHEKEFIASELQKQL